MLEKSQKTKQKPKKNRLAKGYRFLDTFYNNNVNRLISKGTESKMADCNT